MEVHAELLVIPGEEDQYLEMLDRIRLAKSAISQLLLEINEKLGISPHTLHLLLEDSALRMAKIGRRDEDWDGQDLVSARRKTAKQAIIGSKVKP